MCTGGASPRSAGAYPPAALMEYTSWPWRPDHAPDRSPSGWWPRSQARKIDSEKESSSRVYLELVGLSPDLVLESFLYGPGASFCSVMSAGNLRSLCSCPCVCSCSCPRCCSCFSFVLLLLLLFWLSFRRESAFAFALLPQTLRLDCRQSSHIPACLSLSLHGLNFGAHLAAPHANRGIARMDLKTLERFR